jgi:hypothetical protein
MVRSGFQERLKDAPSKSGFHLNQVSSIKTNSLSPQIEILSGEKLGVGFF